MVVYILLSLFKGIFHPNIKLLSHHHFFSFCFSRKIIFIYFLTEISVLERLIPLSYLRTCMCFRLTSNEHDADREDLLRVGVRGHVSKAHAGQRTECEVQCSDVFILYGRPRAGVTVVYFLPNGHLEIVKPADLMVQVRFLHISNGVPDAGEPMGNKSKYTHEEHENCCAVFRVTVQLPGNTDQSEESRCLQQANQSGRLGKREKVLISKIANRLYFTRKEWKILI